MNRKEGKETINNRVKQAQDLKKAPNLETA